MEIEVNQKIAALAEEFKGIIGCAVIDRSNPVKYEQQKLELDVRVMKLEQAARSLLTIIKRMEEMKLTDNFYEPQRLEFDQRCHSEANTIEKTLRESADRLSEIAQQGLELKQRALSLLR